ncbi:MAG: hypothetical protein JW717_01380 [Marinilabiliaceae bacterium]|nr:hypothetical protein [Marinilabiliaceae bacterium]
MKRAMRHMKAKTLILIYLATQLIFISCKKESESLFPKELIFSEIQTDFQLWVGGVKINTDNKDPESIIKAELFEWTKNHLETFKKIKYKFKDEYQLEIIGNESSLEYKYSIKNDSLFIDSKFFSLGNINNISYYTNSVLYAVHYDENYSSSFTKTSTEPTTVNQILQYFDMTDLDDMSDKDTIAILNYFAIYK